MIIRVGNVWGDVPPGIPRSIASNILRYRPKGFQFSPKYRAGTWDGYIRLVSKTGQFPAGLAPYLIERLRLNGLGAALSHENAPPGPHPCLTKALLVTPLRPYQEAAVEALALAGRGVVHHPTGTGKTLIMAGLVKHLAQPTLILCHRTDLMRQLATRLRSSLDVPALVGEIGGGRDEPNFLTVATFQSIHHRLRSYPQPVREMLGRFTAVMVDEVHHVAAKTFGDVMKELTNAYYRIGFSATPDREGDPETFFKAMGWLGPVVSRFSSKDAADQGYVVSADIFLLPGSDISGNDADFYELGVVRDTKRNALIVELAERMARRGSVLVLVERIEHGARLQRGFPPSSLGVEFIHGAIEGFLRTEMLDRFRNGGTDVLIGSEILGEGIDLPNLRTLIIAGAGKAPHRTIQKVGRGMRTSGDKDRVIVFDFMDTGSKTWVDQQGKRHKRPSSLQEQARSRLKTYLSEPAWSVATLSLEELRSWLT